MSDLPPPEPVDPVRYVSEEQVRARALAEVLRDQAERAETALATEERRDRRDRVRRGVLVGTWLVVAWVWVATPSWLRVEPPPKPPVAVEAQSLRLNVFLQSQAIEAYRLQRGRLPFVLQEAGPPFRGMEYRRFDSRSYELQGRSDRVILRYHSDQPAMEFVGNATDVLATERTEPPGGAP
ncbi:MAG TPA: hypothetical protein VLH75_10465 [Longimicrobiales bacterium]|nr:hypothetical protein [Longimicrobiales bacterium]